MIVRGKLIFEWTEELKAALVKACNSPRRRPADMIAEDIGAPYAKVLDAMREMGLNRLPGPQGKRIIGKRKDGES